jgi:putative membrane protein insertion efficiency factor
VTEATALTARRGGRTSAPDALVRGLAAVLGGYKRWVSPLLPPACRFTPTCSEYAREALLKHGVLGGTALAIRRLSHCHPFHRGGSDPVP